MAATAQSSSLFGKIRNSFGQGAMSGAQPPTQSSTLHKLDVLDTILTDIEQSRHTGVVSQALPTATDQAVAAHQPPAPTSQAAKESLAATSPDQPTVEAGTGLQYVEQEKSPEIPVEVESYLQHVEDHAATQPQEVVIADEQQTPLASHYPKKSVVVLPITPEQEQQGARKSIKLSFRWLVEWSRKLMKMFSGNIIYREAEAQQ